MELGQPQIIAYLDKLFLDSLGHRHALILPIHPDVIFLFARRVDSLFTRSFLRITKLPSNIARSLFKRVNSHKEIRIDHDKEMPQMIRSDLSVLIFAIQLFQENAILQSSTQDLHYRRITVALIAA